MVDALIVTIHATVCDLVLNSLLALVCRRRRAQRCRKVRGASTAAIAAIAPIPADRVSTRRGARLE